MNWRHITMLSAVAFLCLIFYWNKESLSADQSATAPATTSASVTMRIEATTTTIFENEPLIILATFEGGYYTKIAFSGSRGGYEYFHLLISNSLQNSVYLWKIDDLQYIDSTYYAVTEVRYVKIIMDKLRVQIPICTDHFKPGIYRMAIGYSAGQSIEDSAHKRGWDITVPTGHYLPDALPGTYPYAVISNDITIQILPRPSMGTPASLPATIPATRAATLPANDYFREQKDRMINVLESDAWYFAVGNIENSVKGNHSPDWHYYVFSNMNYIHFFNSDYSWRAKGEWKIESNPSGTLTLFLKGNDQGGGGLLPESYIDYDPNTDKIVVWGDHYVRPKILSRCYPDPKYPDAFPSLTKPATQPATQP